MPRHNNSLMIIRAWLEHGSEKPLRAHIRLTHDVAAGFSSEVTLVDSAAIAAAVESWLDAVLLNDTAP
jgi:hypothetical protein